MRKTTIGWTATAAVLALTGCGPHRPDPRGVERNEVLLQVSASGQTDTKPDTARFAVGVSSISATSQAATEANNAKMKAVVSALKSLGVGDADLQTKQLTIARQDWGPNKGKFEANNVVEVRMRDVEKAGAAIAGATRAGANVMWGPNLSITDPEAASRNAYTAAFKAARTRADAYASAAGMKVARILRIRDGAAADPVRQWENLAESLDGAAAQAAPPPVMAGTTTQRVSVNVDFALGPK